MTQKTFSSRSSELDAVGAGIVKALGGLWKPGGGMCLCPAHADRTPSLSIRVGRHALLFKCFAGCETRDVIREILRFDQDALVHVRRRTNMSQTMGRDMWKRQRALDIWDQARPIAGTPAEIYLRRRRISLLPSALRYHSRAPLGHGDAAHFRPAMIAALHDGGLHEEGRFVAIQRTFFDHSDGARRARDLSEPRMMFGQPHHGAVILAPANQVLGLAEGIETALSAMMLFAVPVWATLGSERMPHIALPEQVTRLLLFPDNDRAGEIGAANAHAAYAMPSRSIETHYPPAGFKDWNDVLREGGEGVRDWWRQVA